MKEIVVIARDRVGLLADITYMLASTKMNIDTLSVTAVGGEAVIYMGVKDEKKAKKILEANKLKVMSSEQVVVVLEDKPGEMSNLSRMLADYKINILNVHLVSTARGKQIYALRLDKPKKAKKILEPYIAKDDK